MKAEDVGSLLSVSVQMINILTEQNVSRSLAMLKPTDIYIKPDLDGITSGDFQRSSETADRGKKAAEALADRLKGLSVSEEAYAAWVQNIVYARQSPPSIDEIQIVGLNRVNQAAVERHLRVKPGDPVDDVKLNQDMLRIYGDGWYENVDYSLLTARDRNILRVTPVEKRWGPDYLRFGISIDSNFKQDSSYTLRAAYDKTWLNSLGGELLVSTELGRKNALIADLYQPLEELQRYFMESSLSLSSGSVGLYQNSNKLAEYEKNKKMASMGAGMNIGLLGQMHVGWRQTWVEADLETGVPSTVFPKKTKATYGGGYASLDFDQMDRLYFPTSGWASKMSYFNSRKEGYSKLSAELTGAFPLSDYVLNAKLSYQGSPRGQLPFFDAGTLGGFGNMSGFVEGQLNGDDIRYGGVRIEKIIGRLPLGLRGDMRAGFALETARLGRLYTETQRTGWLNSASIYLGGETPFGPVYVGYGRSDSGTSNLYLFLGTP
jgi:NTE family protein